ncbi:MAG: hypothetical protein ACKN89_15455 [Cyanobium sp.]
MHGGEQLPASGVLLPQLLGFALDLRGFSPQLLGLVPDLRGFSPQPLGFAPDLICFVPDLIGFAPDLLCFVPDPIGVAPQLRDFALDLPRTPLAVLNPLLFESDTPLDQGELSLVIGIASPIEHRQKRAPARQR